MAEVQQLQRECDTLKSTCYKICVNIEDLVTDFSLCQLQVFNLNEHFEKTVTLLEALEQVWNSFTHEIENRDRKS